ncbi:choice-of-anchor J domain-containing protein [Psychroserpens sp. BH13MA-6]
MKTFVTYSLLLVLGLGLQAQNTILSEDFEGSSFPPEGWATFRDLDDNDPNHNWTESYNGLNATKCAFSRYSDIGTLPSESWLVTSQIDLTNSTNAILTFFSREEYGDTWVSQYDIRISTNSQTTHSDFSTVITFGEFNPLNYEEITVDLSAYDGQQIYIAFVHVDEYQDDWRVDAIEVTGTIVCDINNVSDSNNNFGIDGTTRLYAQEFVPPCYGTLNTFQFYVYVIPSIEQLLAAGTFNIYEGDLASGTIIHSQDFDDMIPVGADGVLQFGINGNLALQANQMYTFEFPVTSLSIESMPPESYPLGNAYIDGNPSTFADFKFSTSMTEESLHASTIQESLEIAIYPNPTSDYISISNMKTTETYSIYNVLGKVVSSGYLFENRPISVEHLEKGIYFLKLEHYKTFKFIKT